jgi:cytochrome c oxidase subunit 2
MRDRLSRLTRRSVPGAFLLLAACASEHPQTMVEPVTEFGRLQTALWATVTWWTVGIMVVVFGALVFILFRYRDREGRPDPKPIYGSTKLEIAWTLIPALIILFIAVPTIRAIFATQVEAPGDALVVEAIGHQWWWEFRYPDHDVITANEFYVPVGRPIALRLRSADVIHSFWIPRLGGKKDVNPVPRTPEGVDPLHLNQIVVEIDSAGEYLGQCAEFCGTSHAIMRMMALGVEPAEFDAWVRDMNSPVEPAGELAARGRELFLGNVCVACHAIEGTRAAGRLGPDLTHFGERWSIGAGLMDNTPENLTEWIMNAPALKKGILMPGAYEGAGGMQPTELTREEARAIAAYLIDLRRPLVPASRAPQATGTAPATPETAPMAPDAARPAADTAQANPGAEGGALDAAQGAPDTAGGATPAAR